MSFYRKQHTLYSLYMPEKKHYVYVQYIHFYLFLYLHRIHWLNKQICMKYLFVSQLLVSLISFYISYLSSYLYIGIFCLGKYQQYSYEFLQFIYEKLVFSTISLTAQKLRYVCMKFLSSWGTCNIHTKYAIVAFMPGYILPNLTISINSHVFPNHRL